MSRRGVVDRDHGYRRIKDELQNFGKPGVYVGILQDKGSELSEDGEITVAGYAAVNEFGSDDGFIPERSFLRSTVHEQRHVYAAEFRRVVWRMLGAMARGQRGTPVLKRGLGQLGLRAMRDVKDKIRDLREPPNARYTLEKKYPGDNPLIDTGRMRKSISFLVDIKGGRVTQTSGVGPADEGAA